MNYWVFMSLFVRKDLYLAIEWLCRNFIKLTHGKNIDWLQVLPLYHFLRGISQPFVPIEMNPEMQWTFWETITSNRRNFQECLSRQNNRYLNLS